jgi:hypothetical protein
MVIQNCHDKFISLVDSSHPIVPIFTLLAPQFIITSLHFVDTTLWTKYEVEMSNSPELKSVAQNVNDSIRTNETSLTHLEEQIDALTDALVSVNCKFESLWYLHDDMIV